MRIYAYMLLSFVFDPVQLQGVMLVRFYCIFLKLYAISTMKSELK